MYILLYLYRNHIAITWKKKKEKKRNLTFNYYYFQQQDKQKEQESLLCNTGGDVALNDWQVGCPLDHCHHS